LFLQNYEGEYSRRQTDVVATYVTSTQVFDFVPRCILQDIANEMT